MDRLTERDPYWLGEEFWIAAREPDEEAIDAIYERLMEYENTGLTPERCAELAKAEQDGRLVELPCKVGEDCYIANGKGKPALKITVSRFEYNLWQGEWIVHAANDAAFFLSDAYTTREEAEKALESEGE